MKDLSWLIALLALPALAQAPSERFESNVRPVLASHCYACHAGKSVQGGVRLDTLDGLRAAAERVGPAVAHTGLIRMPPAGKLPAAEVAALTAWSADPKLPPAPKKTTGAWWAIQPIRTPRVPSVKNVAWVRSPIDRFILAKLEAKGLKPAPEADRRTWLRRVTFDLTGLPPTIDDLRAFLADRRPDAYARVVDRLLASSAYGEAWGRHWLDVARYADTHGYDKDKRRDNAWRYRDWVIGALNRDLPYRQFVMDQLAGDYLSTRPDGVIAAGYVAAGPWDFVGNVELGEGTVEKEKTRVLDRDDMVSSAIGVFNSVTIHCARCHDHKFDPIPQTDYYALQAVFAGVERGDRPIPGVESTTFSTTGSPTNGYHSAIETRQDVEKWVQVDLGRTVAVDTLRLIPARPTDFADTPGFGFPVRYRVEVDGRVVRDATVSDVANPGAKAVEIPVNGPARTVRIVATRLWPRTGDFVFALAEVQALAGGKNVAVGAKVTALDSIEAGRWGTANLTDGFDSRGGTSAMTYGILSRPPRRVQLLGRGEVSNPRGDVAPHEPSYLSSTNISPAILPTNAQEGARRAALAAWIAHPSNPLTWRSIVNRVWGWHFGRGIVDTPNDFGRNGGAPSHPELLDYLAATFRDRGQSLKALHREIVLSATYRQSALGSPAAQRVDSDNRLLARAPRRRLSAEELRDAILAVSGTLDRTAGGPGFEPFRFKDDHSPIYDHTDVARANDPKTWRRTVYRFVVRSVPHPFLECFDAADPNQSVPVRTATLTPLQALALQNDAFVLDQARRFATRVAEEISDDRQRVVVAFQEALSRSPDPQELESAVALVKKRGLSSLCRALYNVSEFVFID